MSTSTISNNASGDLQVKNEDLEALMALAIGAIDNRLNAGPSICGDKENYNRWRKLALRIADMVEF